MIHHQTEAAVDARVVAQGRQGEFRILAGVEHILGEVPLDAVQQDLPCLGHAAADDDQLGVAHAAHVGEEFAQAVVNKLQSLVCDLVALGRVEEHVAAGQGRHGPQGGGVVAGGQQTLRHAHHAGGAGVLLGAAVLAAAALLGFILVEDNVADFDCYTYTLYFISDGVKGRFADISYQYGPTCSWKVVGQTTNFQGWNGGKIQVKNSFGTVIDEITMNNSTPISQQIRVPEGNVTFAWVAPTTAVTSLTINIKNSNNSSVYTYTGNSNQLPATLYTGDNDCGGCLPPTHFSGEYQWTNEGFGTMLTWDYEGEPQSFKVYRSENGVDYAEIATVDKALREYFDLTDAGGY